MPKGAIKVIAEYCKGCGLCIAACPNEVLALSGELNSSGYNIVHVEKPDDCVGCSLCALTCPDVAIEVYREPVSS